MKPLIKKLEALKTEALNDLLHSLKRYGKKITAANSEINFATTHTFRELEIDTIYPDGKIKLWSGEMDTLERQVGEGFLDVNELVFFAVNMKDIVNQKKFGKAGR